MKLILLGTAGYHPSEQRHTACLMLPELGVVLDAGTAMFRVRQHLQTRTLDIFLSHAHLDHVIGLTYLFDVLWQRPMDRVTVHATADKRAAIQQHLFAEPLFPAQPPLQWRDLTAAVRLSDKVTVRHFPLDHPGGSVGFRLDWPDRSLAYVTDTTAREDAPYLAHLRDVDLLVHECNFPDGWESHAESTGHSCATPVAQVAKACGAGQLVLVHFNPLDPSSATVILNAVRRIFPATTAGTDLLEIEF